MTSKRYQFLRSRACCRVYFISLLWCVCVCAYLTEVVTLRYIPLSQQYHWPLAIAPEMPHCFFSILISLWNHLVTIHSCLDHYNRKNYQDSSKNHLQKSLINQIRKQVLVRIFSITEFRDSWDRHLVQQLCCQRFQSWLCFQFQLSTKVHSERQQVLSH